MLVSPNLPTTATKSHLTTTTILPSWLPLGVCRKPTDPPNPIQPNLIRQVGSVFKAWWVGLGYKKKFYSESGWVWVIKLQTRQTRPDPPIFNIYLKYIIYLIIFFKLVVGHFYIYIYIFIYLFIYLNIYYIFVNFF